MDVCNQFNYVFIISIDGEVYELQTVLQEFVKQRNKDYTLKEF